jgi:maleate cis-trans isomerase
VAREAFLKAPNSDGIYMACARWQTALNIEKLENDLKVPVVTDVQTSIWAAFKRLHIGEVNPGVRRLFGTL